MLGINQRHFSLKNSVEMLSAYMQEVDLNFLIFNLFYLHFCFGPQVCIDNCSLTICAVVSWCGNVRNILMHKHTLYFCHTSLKASLFTPLMTHTQHYGCVTIANWQKPTSDECCFSLPTSAIVSSISFMRGNSETLYDISLPHQGKSN